MNLREIASLSLLCFNLVYIIIIIMHIQYVYLSLLMNYNTPRLILLSSNSSKYTQGNNSTFWEIFLFACFLRLGGNIDITTLNSVQ